MVVHTLVKQLCADASYLLTYFLVACFYIQPILNIIPDHGSPSLTPSVTFSESMHLSSEFDEIARELFTCIPC